MVLCGVAVLWAAVPVLLLACCIKKKSPGQPSKAKGAGKTKGPKWKAKGKAAEAAAEAAARTEPTQAQPVLPEKVAPEADKIQETSQKTAVGFNFSSVPAPPPEDKDGAGKAKAPAKPTPSGENYMDIGVLDRLGDLKDGLDKDKAKEKDEKDKEKTKTMELGVLDRIGADVQDEPGKTNSKSSKAKEKQSERSGKSEGKSEPKKEAKAKKGGQKTKVKPPTTNENYMDLGILDHLGDDLKQDVEEGGNPMTPPKELEEDQCGQAGESGEVASKEPAAPEAAGNKAAFDFGGGGKGEKTKRPAVGGKRKRAGKAERSRSEGASGQKGAEEAEAAEGSLKKESVASDGARKSGAKDGGPEDAAKSDQVSHHKFDDGEEKDGEEKEEAQQTLADDPNSPAPVQVQASLSWSGTPDSPSSLSPNDLQPTQHINTPISHPMLSVITLISTHFNRLSIDRTNRLS